MELSDKLAFLKKIYKDCWLCPQQCHIDRTKGEIGFCGLPAKIIMDCAMRHHGEEPPLSGTGGAGTIFLSSCNLRCIYCQNYQISYNTCGQELTPPALAQVMLDLQKSGCHNIEPVTPTPQTPSIMEALMLAREQGLKIPFVYNCGGYEHPFVIKMLDKMVDIYLPDFKYGLAEDGAAFSGVSDYPRYALDSLNEMVNQVGPGLEMENGIAKKGIIVRHLILPGKLENSKEVFRLIKKEISTSVTISLMSQYTPTVKVRNHPLLGRRINPKEYNEILNFALDLGFDNLFVQEVNDNELTPDFNSGKPFG